MNPIKDEAARDFWRQHFEGRDEVPFKELQAKLKERFGDQFTEQQLETIVVHVMDYAVETDFHIDREEFSRFVRRFGAFPECVRRCVDSVCGADGLLVPWYHGDIDDRTAYKRIQEAGSVLGQFLISGTKDTANPFNLYYVKISRSSGKKAVKRLPIEFDAVAVVYNIELDDADFPTIRDIVEDPELVGALKDAVPSPAFKEAKARQERLRLQQQADQEEAIAQIMALASACDHGQDVVKQAYDVRGAKLDRFFIHWHLVFRRTAALLREHAADMTSEGVDTEDLQHAIDTAVAMWQLLADPDRLRETLNPTAAAAAPAPAAAAASGDEATGDEATGDEATGDEATGDEATGDEATDDEFSDDDVSEQASAYSVIEFDDVFDPHRKAAAVLRRVQSDRDVAVDMPNMRSPAIEDAEFAIYSEMVDVAQQLKLQANPDLMRNRNASAPKYEETHGNVRDRQLFWFRYFGVLSRAVSYKRVGEALAMYLQHHHRVTNVIPHTVQEVVRVLIDSNLDEHVDSDEWINFVYRFGPLHQCYEKAQGVLTIAENADSPSNAKFALSDIFVDGDNARAVCAKLLEKFTKSTQPVPYGSRTFKPSHFFLRPGVTNPFKERNMNSPPWAFTLTYVQRSGNQVKTQIEHRNEGEQDRRYALQSGGVVKPTDSMHKFVMELASWFVDRNQLPDKWGATREYMRQERDRWTKFNENVEDDNENVAGNTSYQNQQLIAFLEHGAEDEGTCFTDIIPEEQRVFSHQTVANLEQALEKHGTFARFTEELGKEEQSTLAAYRRGTIVHILVKKAIESGPKWFEFVKLMRFEPQLLWKLDTRTKDSPLTRAVDLASRAAWEELAAAVHRSRPHLGRRTPSSSSSVSSVAGEELDMRIQVGAEQVSAFDVAETEVMQAAQPIIDALVKRAEIAELTEEEIKARADPVRLERKHMASTQLKQSKQYKDGVLPSLCDDPFAELHIALATCIKTRNAPLFSHLLKLALSSGASREDADALMYADGQSGRNLYHIMAEQQGKQREPLPALTNKQEGKSGDDDQDLLDDDDALLSGGPDEEEVQEEAVTGETLMAEHSEAALLDMARELSDALARFQLEHSRKRRHADKSGAQAKYTWARAYVESFDEDHRTPACIAARRGSMGMLRELVSNSITDAACDTIDEDDISTTHYILQNVLSWAKDEHFDTFMEIFPPKMTRAVINRGAVFTTEEISFTPLSIVINFVVRSQRRHDPLELEPTTRGNLEDIAIALLTRGALVSSINGNARDVDSGRNALSSILAAELRENEKQRWDILYHAVQNADAGLVGLIFSCGELPYMFEPPDAHLRSRKHKRGGGGKRNRVASSVDKKKHKKREVVVSGEDLLQRARQKSSRKPPLKSILHVAVQVENQSADVIRMLLNYRPRADLIERTLEKIVIEQPSGEKKKVSDKVSRRRACLNFSPDVLDRRGRTALHVTAELNTRSTSSRAIASLLQDQIDIMKKDLYGMTALHYAAMNNRLDLTQQLLESHANPQAITSHYSSDADLQQVFNSLSEELQAEFPSEDEVNEQTPLHHAARAGLWQVCASLIKHQAKVDSIDKKGRTPLALALERRKILSDWRNEIREWADRTHAKLLVQDTPEAAARRGHTFFVVDVDHADDSDEDDEAKHDEIEMANILDDKTSSRSGSGHISVHRLMTSRRSSAAADGDYMRVHQDMLDQLFPDPSGKNWRHLHSDKKIIDQLGQLLINKDPSRLLKLHQSYDNTVNQLLTAGASIKTATGTSGQKLSRLLDIGSAWQEIHAEVHGLKQKIHENKTADGDDGDLAGLYKSKLNTVWENPQNQIVIDHIYNKQVRPKHAIRLVIYCVFLVLLTALGIQEATRDTQSAFWMSQGLRQTLVEDEFPFTESKLLRNYEGIDSPDEFFMWMRGPFLDVMYPEADSFFWDGSTKKFDRATGYINNHVRVLGTVRLRQLRSAEQSCDESDTEFAPAGDSCFTAGSDPDNAPFGPGNKYEFRTEDDLEGVPTWGQAGWYGGGGHIVDLPFPSNGTRATVATTIQELEDDNFIDAKTRVLFIEFTGFNPEENHFATATLMLEFPRSGGIVVSSTFDMTKLKRYMGTHNKGATIFLEVMVVFFVLWRFVAVLWQRHNTQLRSNISVPKEGRQHRPSTKLIANADPDRVKDMQKRLELSQQHSRTRINEPAEVTSSGMWGDWATLLPDKYAYLALAILLTGVIIVFLHIWGVVLSDDIDWDSTTDFVKVRRLALINFVQVQCFSVAVFLAWFKILDFLSIFEALSRLVIMIEMMLRELVNFAVLLLIVLVAFTSANAIASGYQEPDSFTWLFSFITHLSFTFVGRDIEARPSGNRVLGVVYPALFAIIVSLLMMNLLIAILNSAYEKATTAAGESYWASWQYDMIVLEYRTDLDIQEKDDHSVFCSPDNFLTKRLPTLVGRFFSWLARTCCSCCTKCCTRNPKYVRIPYRKDPDE